MLKPRGDKLLPRTRHEFLDIEDCSHKATEIPTLITYLRRRAHVVDKQRLALLKKSIVAIGLAMKGDKEPFKVAGTGFSIGDDDVIATAAHVVRPCLKEIRELAAEGIQTELKAFHAESSDSGFAWTAFDFDLPYERAFLNVKVLEKNAKYLGPQDLDLCFMKLAYDQEKIPTMGFNESTNGLIYEDVVMCGYPGAMQSLNVTDRDAAVRLDPVIQFGKVTSLFPNDNTPNALGIQTDIIGTGGSSGSPIVELRTGGVVGIAQEVILGDVVTGTGEKHLGFARVGLVYGVSSYFLFELEPLIHDYYLTAFPSFGEVATVPIYLAPLHELARVEALERETERK